MSKERLSRLQKWILVEAYKKGKRDAILCPNSDIEKDLIKAGLGNFFNAYWIGTNEIYNKYFRLQETGERKKTKAVVLCRSLGKLKERGYFETWRDKYYHVGRERRFVLSRKGVEKAKSIMAGQKFRDYIISEVRT